MTECWQRPQRGRAWWVLLGMTFFLGLFLGIGLAHAEDNDIAIALRVAKAYQLTPFQTHVLLCIRLAEDGKPGHAYGVLAKGAIGKDQTTQAKWAAGSIARRLKTVKDLTSFAARWAPVRAANDPKELNRNWLGNVEQCLAQLEE